MVPHREETGDLEGIHEEEEDDDDDLVTLVVCDLKDK